jgi:hypothetical protein
MKLEIIGQILNHLRTFIKGLGQIRIRLNKENEVDKIIIKTRKNLKILYDDLKCLYDIELIEGTEKILNVYYLQNDEKINFIFKNST